jgi:hypothetical protein
LDEDVEEDEALLVVVSDRRGMDQSGGAMCVLWGGAPVVEEEKRGEKLLAAQGGREARVPGASRRGLKRGGGAGEERGVVAGGPQPWGKRRSRFLREGENHECLRRLSNRYGARIGSGLSGQKGGKPGPTEKRIGGPPAGLLGVEREQGKQKRVQGEERKRGFYFLFLFFLFKPFEFKLCSCFETKERREIDSKLVFKIFTLFLTQNKTHFIQNVFVGKT